MKFNETFFVDCEPISSRKKVEGWNLILFPFRNIQNMSEYRIFTFWNMEIELFFYNDEND